jgi:hypothetical protein
MNACPSREQLALLLEERLDGLRTDEITQHVQTCAACQETLEYDRGGNWVTMACYSYRWGRQRIAERPADPPRKLLVRRGNGTFTILVPAGKLGITRMNTRPAKVPADHRER